MEFRSIQTIPFALFHSEYCATQKKMSQEFDPHDFQAGHKEHKEHKEGFMERIFGHHPRHDDNKASAENESQKQEQEQEQDQTTNQRESNMDDFRDYLGKDKQLEEEGKTYGGLI